MEKRIVKIEWTGPFDPKRVPRNEDEFYQFYGCHLVYGRNVLLYICRGDDIYFRKVPGETINTHRWANIKRVPRYFKPEKITVRVGKIVNNEDEVSLETIRGMLIFLHSPAWNANGIEKSHVSDLSCNDVEIKNIGEKGGLSEKVEGKNCY